MADAFFISARCPYKKNVTNLYNTYIDGTYKYWLRYLYVLPVSTYLSSDNGTNKYK